MTFATPVYSTLLHCVYDQPEPLGALGGTHYSVLSCAEWFDVCRKPLTVAQIHRFAVIWDVDHDTRIIDACEKLYVAGLLSPVQFIGEHKGTLNIVIAAKAYWGMAENAQEYAAKVDSAIMPIFGDEWPIELGLFDRAPGNPHQNDFRTLLGLRQDEAYSYLKTIDMTWGLGTREWSAPDYSALVG